MHQSVFYVATIWMAGLIGGCLLIMLRSRSGLVRVLALDTLTIMLIGLLVVYADSRGVPYYLDAALVLALLSFLSTVVAARYYSEGKIF
jgi:multisubunit Na+/H+ antiporter MnhF subunit